MTSVTSTKPETWRSKLGKDYAKDFMVKNESQLLKQLHQVRDEDPSNRFCADCGTRGTVWASVNLGVFLCMTCGAHHRSLGTHISKPKGCTGTYWWSPDEIEQMRSVGNARARAMYGAAQPPAGITNADAVAWQKFLVDKYVHKKYAGRPVDQSQSGGHPKQQPEAFSPLAGRKNSVGKPPVFAPQIWRTQPGQTHRSGEVDLISFEEAPRGDFSLFSGGKRPETGGPRQASPGWARWPAPEKPSADTRPAATNSDDFFGQFGL